MAESEMVERVARKLCCKGGCYIRRMNERAVTAELYDMPWSCLWESKIDDARDAIEAMRDPPAHVLDAMTRLGVTLASWFLKRGTTPSTPRSPLLPRRKAMTDGWRHIDTAPRDGTRVLVFCPATYHDSATHQIAVARHRSYGWALADTGSYAEDDDLEGVPSHWMPLPAPPDTKD